MFGLGTKKDCKCDKMEDLRVNLTEANWRQQKRIGILENILEKKLEGLKEIKYAKVKEDITQTVEQLEMPKEKKLETKVV